MAGWRESSPRPTPAWSTVSIFESCFRHGRVRARRDELDGWRRDMGRIVARSTTWLAVLSLTALLATTVSPPVGAQTAQTKQVMHQKLAHSEQLLAALVTSNWVALDGHSRALEAL